MARKPFILPSPRAVFGIPAACRSAPLDRIHAERRDVFNAKSQRGQPQPKTEGEQKQTKETKWEGPWKNTWELENYSSFPAFASVQTLV